MPANVLAYAIRVTAAFLLVSLLGLSPATARVIWVGPSGGSCETTSLSAAVLTAAFESGDDAIHLADGVSHTNINVALNGFDPGTTQGSLSIRGGYANCGDANPTSGRTLIDGGASDPIFEIMEDTNGDGSVVELVDLELTGAGVRALELDTGADVTLTNVWIRDNGGGTRVRGNGQLNMDAESWIFSNSVSGGFGGGINCGDNAVVVVGGPVSGNFAGQRGGGLFAGGSCHLTLQGKAWIQSNSAAVFGGGIAAFGTAVVNSGAAPLGIFINSNSAPDGGGLHVDGATVGLSNARINFNEADRGAAIYATGGALVNVNRTDAYPCQDSLRCSQISSNLLGDGGYGGVAWVDGGSDLFISQTFVENNGSSTGRENEIFMWTLEDSGSFVNLENVTIWGNDARFIATSLSGAAASITLRNVTIGGNFYPDPPDGDQPIGLFTGTDATNASVFSSLFWNMGETVSNYGGSCVLADNPDVLSQATASATIADPGFRNLAGGDLRLLSSSPAVDACLDGQGTDIEGEPRPQDIPANSNGSPGESGGLYDAGSDEVQTENTRIFSDRFETL